MRYHPSAAPVANLVSVPVPVPVPVPDRVSVSVSVSIPARTPAPLAYCTIRPEPSLGGFGRCAGFTSGTGSVVSGLVPLRRYRVTGL